MNGQSMPRLVAQLQRAVEALETRLGAAEVRVAALEAFIEDRLPTPRRGPGRPPKSDKWSD